MALPTTITGNGTTITGAGLTSWAGKVISIGEFRESVDSIPANDLSTTGHDQYIAGDLVHHTAIPCTIVFDTTDIIPLGQAAGTITITFANSDTLAGTAYIEERAVNGIENDQRIEGEFMIRFDGDTGPAWTDVP